MLVVEDDPGDAGILREALDTYGCLEGSRLVTSGEAAMAHLDAVTPSSTPRLVLLDLDLPGCNGIDVLGRIRRTWTDRELPVVVLTGRGSHNDAIRCYRHGANAVTFKPVDLDAFIAMVMRILGFWVGVAPTGRSVG